MLSRSLVLSAGVARMRLNVYPLHATHIRLEGLPGPDTSHAYDMCAAVFCPEDSAFQLRRLLASDTNRGTYVEFSLVSSLLVRIGAKSSMEK